MASNLFVTGFPYKLTQEELAKKFSVFGTVVHVKILTDRNTGESRGIGFVKMSSDAEGDAAIAQLNNTPIGERTLFVEAAKPPPDATPRGVRPPAGPADFVERRSGKDRRRQPVGPWDPNDRRNNSGAARPTPAPAGEKRWEKKPFGDKKPWEKKSGGFGDRKPWEKKPAFGEKKPWDKKPAFGEKKPWEKKPAFGEKKPWDKKPAFGEKKPWEKKPAFGEKKPWDKKPGESGEKRWDKKFGFGAKKSGPGDGGKKRFFKPGGFGGKGARRP
jgi:RNA recognition motif-containing protein